MESSSPYHEQIHLVFLGGKVETTAKQPPARADGRVLLAEVDQLIPDRRAPQTSMIAGCSHALRTGPRALEPAKYNTWEI